MMRRNEYIQEKIIFPIIELVRDEPISRCLDELNKSQWFGLKHLHKIQFLKIKKILSHCQSNVDYYKRLFSLNGINVNEINDIDDLSNIPFLTKDIIRLNYSNLMDITNSRKVEQCHSGGTQGKPLNLIRDALSSAYSRAALCRALSWYGIKRSDRQIRVWGLPVDRRLSRKERFKDYLLNRRRISAFAISRKKAKEHFQIIKCFGPRYIYGYVSGIYRLCKCFEEENLNARELGISHVVVTAEALSPHQRRYIEDNLCCRVINEYGCGEVGPIAHECPSGSLHINMENILIEFAKNGVDGERQGEIVLTNLNSLSMPLIRYKIGDIGEKLERKCSCGRELEVMGFNAGRVVNTLVTPSGEYIAGNIFRYLAFDFIEKYGGIKDFKVVQTEKDKLEIFFSKDNNYVPDLLDLFTEKIRYVFGKEMRIVYFSKKEIELERSGKRLFVESKILKDEEKQ